MKIREYAVAYEGRLDREKPSGRYTDADIIEAFEAGARTVIEYIEPSIKQTQRSVDAYNDLVSKL